MSTRSLAACLMLFAAQAAAAPPPRPAPRPSAPPARPSAPAPAPVAIAHKEVGCVPAGRFPRFQACFSPADAVARARVEFRSDERSVWYAVDMAREGECYAALLPKPTPALERFQYFVEAVDRSFTTVLSPAGAPGTPYAPRVVKRESECGPAGLAATGQPTGSIVVSVARDAAGRAVQAAAQAAGAPASISGFSMDGVTVPGAAPGSTGSSGATSGSAGASGVAGTGIGLTAIAIGGGVVAAGAVVAVAASRGGHDTSGTKADAGLTGRWTGTAANGGGLTEVVNVEGLTCTWVWDLTLDLVQSGSSLSGTITADALRSFSCSIPLPVPGGPGSGGSASLSGSTTGSSLTFQAADATFTGTRSGERLSGTGTQPAAGATVNFTWSASR